MDRKRVLVPLTLALIRSTYYHLSNVAAQFLSHAFIEQ